MQTFSKDERLCSKYQIDQLVQHGRSFSCFPFKVIWLELEGNSCPVKIVISVPKRKFKKAVDRNRIKRLTREAYRKNKQSLIEKCTKANINIMLIYIASAHFEYVEIEKKIKQILTRLASEISSLE